MNSSISRRAFLEGAAVAVGAVLVGGCGSGAPAQLQAKAGDAGFSIAGAPLPKPGEAVSFSFPDARQGILYTSKDGASGAVSAVCTHQGCIVEWTEGDPKAAFACPCHKSNFGLNGQVLGGPARAPLAHYAARQNGGDVELKLA